MAIKLALEPRNVPLTHDEHGVWRVTGTTIPLERVIECHQAGLTPEAIVDAYDSLRLPDVYAVISYYLDHKAEVDEYLLEQEEKATELRKKIETELPLRPGLREEILARWARREENNAPAGN